MTKISKRNIHQSFKGCRQTFKDYKTTFIYALLVTYTKFCLKCYNIVLDRSTVEDGNDVTHTTHD